MNLYFNFKKAMVADLKGTVAREFFLKLRLGGLGEVLLIWCIHF